MATYEQHISKYTHNKNFCSHGISNRTEDFSDWEVTARFYAAIHLIEAIIFKLYETHSRDHSMRDCTMITHPDVFTKACASDYSTLKALARKSRYETGQISAEEARKAQVCLDDLVSECEAYIS